MNKKNHRKLISLSLFTMLLLTINSCIKEYPENQFLSMEVIHPDTIHLEKPDTIYFKAITDSGYLRNIYLFEDQDTIYQLYISSSYETRKYKNQFIYNPQNTGVKHLCFEAVSTYSIKKYNFTFLVVE